VRQRERKYSSKHWEEVAEEKTGKKEGTLAQSSPGDGSNNEVRNFVSSQPRKGGGQTES